MADGVLNNTVVVLVLSWMPACCKTGIMSVKTVVAVGNDRKKPNGKISSVFNANANVDDPQSV
jgi:hypothetical protein